VPHRGEDRAVRTGTAAASDPSPVVPPAMAGAAPTAGRLRPLAGGDRRPGDVVLGRFALVRILGRGGAGTVWMAEDQQLGRLVALKCLPGDGGDRALGEGRAAARLGHPTVVTTYGLASAEGCTWLVTEFVAGDTLRRTIREDTHTDDELLQIGIALCVALKHAHAHGIVHRDVTPRNVLVPADAFARVDGGVSTCHPHVPPAKLADFGIARPTEHHEETREGRIVGTLSYMAPERLEGGQGDEAGDLWALGVVLHESFVGEHPAGRPERAEALVRSHAHIPSLRPRRPDLPSGVLDAIDRAVTELPEERGDVRDLERALRQGLAERGVAVAPVLREQSTRDAVAVRVPEPWWRRVLGGPADDDVSAQLGPDPTPAARAMDAARAARAARATVDPRTPLGRAVPAAAALAALAGPAVGAAVTLALVAAAVAALCSGGSPATASTGSRRLAAGLVLVALAVAGGALVVAPVVGAVAGGAAVVLAPVLAGGLAVAAAGCPGLARAPRSIR